ncbi:Glycoside hydrolase family 28, partial [Arabidopsis suecica]
MGFAFVNDSGVQRIKSLKSNMGHFYFFSVHLFNIIGICITAPGDSPNTNEIKMGFSSNIHISSIHTGTGDDCVAILSRTT